MKQIKEFWLVIAGVAVMLLICLFCFDLGRTYERSVLINLIPDASPSLYPPIVIESSPDLLPVYPIQENESEDVDL